MEKESKQQEPTDEQIILFLMDYRNRAIKGAFPLIIGLVSFIMIGVSLIAMHGLLITALWCLMTMTSFRLTGNLNPSKMETEMAKHYTEILKERNKK